MTNVSIDRHTHKLHNLTIDNKNQIIGNDKVIYGFIDEFFSWNFNFVKKSGKPETIPPEQIESVDLSNGLVTITFKTGRKPLYFTKSGKVKEPIIAAPETEDLEPISEPMEAPETVEPLPDPEPMEAPDKGIDTHTKRLDEIETKLIGLRLGYGGLGNTPIYSDDGQYTYGYVSENYTKITLSDGIVYNAFQCTFDEINFIELQQDNSIIVSFKDGKDRSFSRYIESDSGTNPMPEYDGSLLTLEELIRYVFKDQLDGCMYTSDIDHKQYFDWSMIGYPELGIKEYQATGELTKICQILEQRTEYIDRKGQLKHLKISRDSVGHVLSMMTQHNNVNPFLEEIKTVEPDEKYRIESFLRDVGFVSKLPNYDDDTRYIENVSCALFLAVIERQLVNDDERAIRFVPILIGSQNLGKSLVCKKLGLTDYYSESTASIEDEKKYTESIGGGCVISEIAEGTQFVQGKENAYKSWFDKNTYSFRMSYGRQSMTFQKRFIEIITTNDHQILTDVTGNTRYYPIFMDLSSVVIPIQEHDREMMKKYYADALQRFKKGERWYHHVDNSDFQKLANIVRSAVTRDIDGLSELIAYIEEKCSEIGKIITNEEIRNYLNVQPIDTKQIEKLIRLWGKIAGNYGFKKLPTGSMVKDGLVWKHARGYQKIE